MTPLSRYQAAERVVRTYWPIIEEAAKRRQLDPEVVAAVICQESVGNPYAVRPELGFWQRYAPGIARLIASTPTSRDDHWAKYPALASSSYGLMQVLYIVALEYGYRFEYPTELCEPRVNLEAGCRHLATLTSRKGGSVDQGLLAYNGGGDPEYPTKVHEWLRIVRAAKAAITS